MKFKPIYLYGLLLVASIIILVVISGKQSNLPTNNTSDQNLNLPDDDIHNQLKNQGTTSPGKENVSEEYRKKIIELEQAVKQNPEDTISLRKYADYLAASHKMNEAITYYEQILKINPKRADIHFSLAIIYYNQQDFRKCEEENNKVLTFDPKNQMAIYNLGAIAATQGKVEEAKQFWNRVISINSESKTARLANESLNKLR
jgi:cytochrome c-type biogenesis protein CcmH/NrfG